MNKDIVLNAVKQFEELDINENDAYDKAILIFQSIGHLPVLLDEMKTNTRLCRTRTHLEDVLFPNIEDVTTAKPHHVASFGRCNKPNQPMFYSSEDRITSYSELVDYWLKDSKDGDCIYVTIGAWYTMNSMNHIIIPSPDAELRTCDFEKYYGNILDHVLNDFDDNLREAYSEFYRFLHKMFSANAKHNKLPYLITSAYSNLALEKSGVRADGILYPSVPYAKQGLNFALRPEYITAENIELRSVQRDRFQRHDNGLEIPDFKQVEYIQASKVDITSSKLEWQKEKVIVKVVE